MGENSAATVREIEQTRERLEEELTELQDRMPEPKAVAKRAAIIAASAGAAATVAWVALRRRRARRLRAEQEARLASLAPVIKVLPDDWADRIRVGLDDGRWKPWVAGAAGLYVAFRFVELRQLRKMNKALAEGR